MSFGTDLKNEFDNLCLSVNGRVKEETYLNKLVDAFNTNVNTGIEVEIIHGNRWCVRI